MRDSLEGSHVEAVIQHNALRLGKNLAFSEDTCLEKERVQFEGDPKQSWSGIEVEGRVVK